MTASRPGYTPREALWDEIFCTILVLLLFVAPVVYLIVWGVMRLV